jgi:hypothetical protein
MTNRHYGFIGQAAIFGAYAFVPLVNRYGF